MLAPRVGLFTKEKMYLFCFCFEYMNSYTVYMYGTGPAVHFKVYLKIHIFDKPKMVFCPASVSYYTDE